MSEVSITMAADGPFLVFHATKPKVAAKPKCRSITQSGHHCKNGASTTLVTKWGDVDVCGIHANCTLNVHHS